MSTNKSIPIYGISDLHLSGIPPFKNMTAFGSQYNNYMQRIELGFKSLPSNAIVLNCGDISWSISRDEALQDFKWLDSFGIKIVNSIGNHDYYWGSKSAAFMSAWAFDNGLKNIYFVDHRQLFTLGFSNGVRVAAVKGVEKFPKYEFDVELLPSGHQRVENVIPRHYNKYVNRLKFALELNPDILMCHIPPFNIDGTPNELTEIVEKSNVSMILYGHRHKSQPNEYDNNVIRGKFWRNLLAERMDFCPVHIGEVHEDGTKLFTLDK